ncbi:MAG: hypothetical protein K2X01_05155 [Cyanobacteria bacterium]|nr:hypothetical protein [Cyanobacteriota bacterium]
MTAAERMTSGLLRQAIRPGQTKTVMELASEKLPGLKFSPLTGRLSAQAFASWDLLRRTVHYRPKDKEMFISLMHEIFHAAQAWFDGSFTRHGSTKRTQKIAKTLSHHGNLTAYDVYTFAENCWTEAPLIKRLKALKPNAKKYLRRLWLYEIQVHDWTLRHAKQLGLRLKDLALEVHPRTQRNDYAYLLSLLMPLK